MKCKTCGGTGEIEKMDYNLMCPECLGRRNVKPVFNWTHWTLIAVAAGLLIWAAVLSTFIL